MDASEIPCGFCDTILRGSQIGCWGPHDGGEELEGFGEKQWVYVTCSKCGYDWSLAKLGPYLKRRVEA